VLPYSSVVTNRCTGESVAVDGYLRLHYRVERDAADGYHLEIAQSGNQLAGIGLTSGDRYRMVNTVHNTVTSRFDPVLSTHFATVTETIKLVSAGSGNNLSLVVTQHLTISASGEYRAFVFETRETCQG
jgi:hypothetical protein